MNRAATTLAWCRLPSRGTINLPPCPGDDPGSIARDDCVDRPGTLGPSGFRNEEPDAQNEPGALHVPPPRLLQTVYQRGNFAANSGIRHCVTVRFRSGALPHGDAYFHHRAKKLFCNEVGVSPLCNSGSAHPAWPAETAAQESVGRLCSDAAVADRGDKAAARNRVSHGGKARGVTRRPGCYARSAAPCTSDRPRAAPARLHLRHRRTRTRQSCR